MPVQKVKDFLGFSMNLYVFEKKPQYFGGALFNHDMMENMPDYPLREDDVILCSYPKSGCHWVWEISRLLMSGRTSADKVDKEQFMMEASKCFNSGDIDDLPSPRLLNNHAFFEQQPKDILKKGVKVIHVYRNPKDVAVSYFYHNSRIPAYKYSNSDFSKYLPRFVDGLVASNCVFDYMRDWERAINEQKDLNACVICYENMHENPLEEVRKLAKFLGKDYDDEFLQKVINATTMENVIKQKDILHKDKSGPIMYRKGKVGDWKNHFTVAQSEWFDHITRSRMGSSKIYTFKYEI
ncbi:amine sulfotransferase [Aplysia californica]|uniref:Amine sulfotransferase n=1 Tax=Aplysia californica TaxID=6500 RepID=A0ABM0K7C0_APLCA|nr:amine sulfotransferase [Aplysia californica]